MSVLRLRTDEEYGVQTKGSLMGILKREIEVSVNSGSKLQSWHALGASATPTKETVPSNNS